MTNKTTISKSSRNIKKKKKNDSKRVGFLLFVVVIFLVILVSTIFKDLEQIVSNKSQTKELKTKYEVLLEEEASLNSEVTKLQDPRYVERYAREKYMYTKDGEKILIIIDDDGNKSDEENAK